MEMEFMFNLHLHDSYATLMLCVNTIAAFSACKTFGWGYDSAKSNLLSKTWLLTSWVSFLMVCLSFYHHSNGLKLLTMVMLNFANYGGFAYLFSNLAAHSVGFWFNAFTCSFAVF